MVEGSMGFVPNSFLTMARWPELLSAFSAYAGTVMGPGVIEAELEAAHCLRGEPICRDVDIARHTHVARGRKAGRNHR